MNAAQLKERAAQCRRLAAALAPGDPARVKLLELADEYETALERLRAG
jgi:hypothetical protein